MLNRIEARCRAKGLRLTGQRRAIAEKFWQRLTTTRTFTNYTAAWFAGSPAFAWRRSTEPFAV